MSIAVVGTPDYQLAKIPLNQLRPFHHQLRKNFEPEALKQLAESIRAQGVAQPIIVRTAKPGGDGTKTIEPWEIIAGERRWRASAMAGRDDIPAIIRDDLSDSDVEVLHLIENLQRQDLDLVETCDGAAKLVALVGFDKACEQAGQTAAWMSRHSRLGTLDSKVQALVRGGKLASMEMAHDVEQLKAYDARQFESVCQEFDARNQWFKPPTREQLRTRVKDAKSSFEAKQKQEAQKKKEKEELKAKLKANPKLKEQMAAEKAKSPETQRKDREAGIRSLKTEGEIVARELTQQLLQISGFDLTKPKGKGKEIELPVEIRLGHYSIHDHSPVPKTVDDASFTINFSGGINAIAPGLNLIAPGARVDLDSYELENITQDEARKIEQALGRPLHWNADCKSTTAKKLRSLIANAQGKQTADQAKASGKPIPNLSVSDFLGLRVERKRGAKVKAADLHAAYAAWCESMSRKHEILPLNSNEFGAAIAKAKIEKVRSNGIHYVGIELKA